MNIDTSLIDFFTKATEKAACGAYPFIGKGDKISADKAAVDNMRNQLNSINMASEIVIGEGELDDAPMLHIGEKVGVGKGSNFDIAVDPVEGTNFVAKNLPNAISVLAVANKNCMLKAPETYMEKIAVGKNLPANLLDLDNSIEKNIKLLSEAKNTTPEKLVACILKRPRHDKIVKSLISLNVKIKFITDGDVMGALLVADQNSIVDIYLGIGGGPEGVIAAAALSCLGGQMQTRLVFEKEIEKKRALEMGIKDFKKKYNISDMINGDIIFSATGITSGDIISGVKDCGSYYETETFILHKNSKTNKKIKNQLKK